MRTWVSVLVFSSIAMVLAGVAAGTSGSFRGQDEDVPAAERSKSPREALGEGTEVRVTAEQGDDGEWRASRVEVLPHSSEGGGILGSGEPRKEK